MKKTLNKLTYAKSGVNIKKADKLIGNLKKGANPKNPNVVAGIGGFSSLYALDIRKYTNPLIVAGTDGVGTKLKLAALLNEHRYIGQDLLAMCLNDVITSGAEPLFFLDYLATSKIDVQLHTKVLKGIKKACNAVKIPLIGGETAEMPGMYKNKDYDLAGFCVGIVDKHKMIDKKLIKNGDLIVGIPSSGFHSNGYSLINKLIETNTLSLKKKYDGIDLRKALIKPTKLYSDLFFNLQKKISIHGAAHITGGGITDNVPRILTDKFMAKINLSSWSLPKIFKLIQKKAALTDIDMLKTFNCGIGMVLIIDKKDLNKLISVTTMLKYKPKIIGCIAKKNSNKAIIYEKN